MDGEMNILYPVPFNGDFDQAVIDDAMNSIARLDNAQLHTALFLMARLAAELAQEKHDLELTSEQKEQWVIALQGAAGEQAVSFLNMVGVSNDKQHP